MIFMNDIDIIRLIGEGSFGKVYEAVDKVLGQVAVKIIERSEKYSEEYWKIQRQDFITEGKNLKKAEHPNIVRIFQAQESEDSRFIQLIMEYCEYGSIETDYKKGPLPILMVRDILSQVLLGLQAVHARGMLHRDIKPANILISKDRRYKIADFGLVTDDILYGFASADGYALHCAKEFYTRRVTSIQTDIWALGMTAYRLLHGHHFYLTKTEPADMIAKGGYSNRLLWLPHIPKIWKKILLHSLYDDDNRRIQDTAEFLRLLERLPVEPNWECNYSDTLITWSRIKGNRRINVWWDISSIEQTEWEARSFPLNDSGNERRLDGTSEPIHYDEAYAKISKYLCPDGM